MSVHPNISNRNVFEAAGKGDCLSRVALGKIFAAPDVQVRLSIQTEIAMSVMSLWTPPSIAGDAEECTMSCDASCAILCVLAGVLAAGSPTCCPGVMPRNGHITKSILKPASKLVLGRR